MLRTDYTINVSSASSASSASDQVAARLRKRQ